MDVGVVPHGHLRQRCRELPREHRPARPRVRVLEDERLRAGLHDLLLDLHRGEPPVLGPERDGIEPGHLLDAHRLRGEDVRRGLEDDRASPWRDRDQRDEIRHAAGGHPESALLAEETRHALLQLVDGRVLAEGRPAELRRPHRLPHLLRRTRVEVGPEVDRRFAHRRSRCRPGRAPVCSAPSTTTTPLTRTCSTPRAYTVGLSLVETSSSSS